MCIILNKENKGKIIKKKIGYYGIVFCYEGIYKINLYIEFKVIVSYRDKSYLFLRLLNKIFDKFEHLLCSFLKDSLSSFYWVFGIQNELKLMKRNSN